jgi:hypothetical protein
MKAPLLPRPRPSHPVCDSPPAYDPPFLDPDPHQQLSHIEEALQATKEPVEIGRLLNQQRALQDTLQTLKQKLRDDFDPSFLASCDIDQLNTMHENFVAHLDLATKALARARIENKCDEGLLGDAYLKVRRISQHLVNVQLVQKQRKQREEANQAERKEEQEKEKKKTDCKVKVFLVFVLIACCGLLLVACVSRLHTPVGLGLFISSILACIFWALVYCSVVSKCGSKKTGCTPAACCNVVMIIIFSFSIVSVLVFSSLEVGIDHASVAGFIGLAAGIYCTLFCIFSCLLIISDASMVVRSSHHYSRRGYEYV